MVRPDAAGQGTLTVRYDTPPADVLREEGFEPGQNVGMVVAAEEAQRYLIQRQAPWQQHYVPVPPVHQQLIQAI